MATASAISGSSAAGTLDLRPLGLGELLDRTIAIYRNHFPLFVGISAPPHLMTTALKLVQFAMAGALTYWFPASRAARPRPDLIVWGPKYGTVFWALIIVDLFAYSVAMGATTFAVSEIYLGRRASVRGAYRLVRPRIWGLTDVGFSTLMRTIACFVLVCLFIIVVLVMSPLKLIPSPLLITLSVLLPAVFLSLVFSLRYSVSIPALLVENLRPRQAIKRSIELIRGRLRSALLVFLSMALVTLTILAVFQAPPQTVMMLLAKKGVPPLWLAELTVLMAGVGGTLGSPLLTIAFALFYYDLRIRREALDLQVMMAALAPAPGPRAISAGESSEIKTPAPSAPPAIS